MGRVGGRIPARATQLPTAGHLRVRALMPCICTLSRPSSSRSLAEPAHHRREALMRIADVLRSQGGRRW